MSPRLLFAIVLSFLVTTAGAAVLEAPTADYSADRIIETSEGAMQQKVYASGEKERTEMTVGGMQMIGILRRDKQVMWSIMPTQRMYMEIGLRQALAQQPASGPQPGTEITEVGTETIDGIRTTKYRMTVSDKSVSGFLWLTKDNIALKMDLQTKAGSGDGRVVMRLQNLRMGRQDAAKFEVPAGYNKMQLPGLGGFGAPAGR